jgi:hypothetical protein
MKHSRSSLVPFFIALAVGSTAVVSISAQTDPSREAEIKTIRGIGKQKAISIARNEARRRHMSLAGFRAVPCEQVAFWRIIFDGGGAEFVISKRTGLVLQVKTVPQMPSGEGASTSSPITRQRAIEIARAEVRRVYGPKGLSPDNLAVIACEQNYVWRVIFDFKLPSRKRKGEQLLPNGRYPNYVIDKKTGNILFSELD